MYRALLTVAWFLGTIYATIPLFALIVRPFAKFLRARRSRLCVVIPSWFVMMAVIYFMMPSVTRAAKFRTWDGFFEAGMRHATTPVLLPLDWCLRDLASEALQTPHQMVVIVTKVATRWFASGFVQKSKWMPT
jgi:hypothetical protein